MSLPEGWKQVTLADLAVKEPNAIVDGPFGSNLKLTDYVENGIPVLQGKNITANEFHWFDIRFISQGKANELKRSLVRVGDILIVKIGSIGYSARISTLEGYPYALIPANLCKMSPDCNAVDVNYLIHFLKSPLSVKYLTSNASATSQPALSLEKVKQLPVLLPPRADQQRIAALLDRADRLRRMRGYAEELSASFLQAVFAQMFGDPVRNPMGWEQESLADLCLSNGIKAGPFGSSLKKAFYSKSGIRIYGQEQVISGSFAIGDYYVSETMFEDFKQYEVNAGDVLISLVGTLGKVLVVPEGIERGITNPRLLKVSPEPNKLNSVFLAHFIQHPITQSHLSIVSHGGTMDILNASILKELRTIAPPLALQQKFAGIVQQHERLRAQQREAERQAEHLFHTLLHRAFTGEL